MRLTEDFLREYRISCLKFWIDALENRELQSMLRLLFDFTRLQEISCAQKRENCFFEQQQDGMRDQIFYFIEAGQRYAGGEGGVTSEELRGQLRIVEQMFAALSKEDQHSLHVSLIQAHVF
jgi:hypothetical protein